MQETSKIKNIQFSKNVRYLNESHKVLTPELAIHIAKSGKLVQLNLDLNVLIVMEQLPENATLQDLKAVGLMPLYHLLQTGVIVMSAMGINEAKEKDITIKHDGYNRFCNKFWKGHHTDSKATYRSSKSKPPLNYHTYWGLEDAGRYFYGYPFLAMLLIQDIRKNYQASPTEQFRCYLNGMISMVDRLHAFEIEIAKYAFWSPNGTDLQNYPEEIGEIYRAMRDNFFRKKGNKKTYAAHCLNAAMDIAWISGSALSEEMGNDIEINGQSYKVENWLATLDEKLHRIHCDYHPVREKDSTTQRFSNIRQNELTKNEYWQTVDSISLSISQKRNTLFIEERKREEALFKSDPEEYHRQWRLKEKEGLHKLDTSIRKLEQRLDSVA